MTQERITVVGAGIIGVWQALTLARAGHRVKLLDQRTDPIAHSASAHAGAMLAPGCEGEIAPPIVRDLGYEGLRLWREACPAIEARGSLVVAQPRDQPDLKRFARLTEGHKTLHDQDIDNLEPSLAGRFTTALYFPDEAHIAPREALRLLLDCAHEAGCDLHLGQGFTASDREGLVVDCRGYAATDILPDLRGVRGERILIATREIGLSRPVRLLHPRHPLYVVPWGEDRYLIGATMIESDDEGPVTVRSALELLGTAYALHPAFGEATILEIASGVRPSFPDNVPRARILNGGRTIAVNGAYRHGFLLAPVLAAAVESFIASGVPHPLIELAGSGRP